MSWNKPLDFVLHYSLIPWEEGENTFHALCKFFILFKDSFVILDSPWTHLEAVIGPTPELHHTSLLVKRKVFHIHLRKWYLVYDSNEWLYWPHRRSGKWPGVSTPPGRQSEESLWWPKLPQNYHQRWKCRGSSLCFKFLAKIDNYLL